MQRFLIGKLRGPAFSSQPTRGFPQMRIDICYGKLYNKNKLEKHFLPHARRAKGMAPDATGQAAWLRYTGAPMRRRVPARREVWTRRDERRARIGRIE